MLSPQTIQVNIQHILGHHFSRLTNLPLCNDYIRRRAQARRGLGEEDKGREEEDKGREEEDKGRKEEDKRKKEVERVGR